MTLIFDELVEKFAAQPDSTFILTDFETTRYERGDDGGVLAITETAISLGWKEEEAPWSNFTVTKKRRSPVSETVTYSGVASVPESPLRRLPITAETKPLEMSTSLQPQKSETVWTGKESLQNLGLEKWLEPLSQDSSLSILGITSDGTQRYRVRSSYSTNNELSVQEAGLETLYASLSKTIGSFLAQHPEIHGLIIFPSSLPTDSIVLVRSSSKSTSNTFLTSNSPRLSDTETSEDSSD